MDKRYELRCVLHYANRPSWRSQWGMTGPNQCDFAWSQPREGLVAACIEAKDVNTKQIVSLVECDGPDFCDFRWVAVTKVPLGTPRPMETRGVNVGLTLVMRRHSTTVLMDGRINVQDRDPSEDRMFHYGRVQ